jgi:hypothetical protein
MAGLAGAMARSRYAVLDAAAMPLSGHVWNCDYRHRRCRRNLPAVLLYGIASARSGDIEIWSTTRHEADATLAEILRDEPDLRALSGSRRSSSSSA